MQLVAPRAWARARNRSNSVLQTRSLSCSFFHHPHQVLRTFHTLCPGLRCEPRKPVRDFRWRLWPIICHFLSSWALDIWMGSVLTCSTRWLSGYAWLAERKGEAGQRRLSPSVCAGHWAGPHSPPAGLSRLQSWLHSGPGIPASLSPSAPVPSGSTASAPGATRAISAHKQPGPRPHMRGVCL